MTLNLSKLNERQRQAVLFGEGPLLILAGAGSGKTSTMAYRIAHLIGEKKISPSNILGLSFTNKAAKELKERVRKLSGDTSHLVISTFHSLCARVLRENAEQIGFQKNFTIIDQADQRDIVKGVFKNLNIDDRKFDHDTLLFEFGRLKSALIPLSQAESFFTNCSRLPELYQIAAPTVFEKYQAQLKHLNSMDFDDLQYLAVALLRDFPEIKMRYQNRFKYLLVDEYQDTNPTQFQILRQLTEHSQNLCVVGDDDQSIYSWRGADAGHILEFKNHFPKAQVVTLDQNYRSTSRILDAANSVIFNNRHRHPKKLWSAKGQGESIQEWVLEDDRDEAEFVANQISEIAKSRAEVRRKPGELDPLPYYKDFVILYRSNAQSRVFEEALRRAKIPYQIVGGMSFLERKEVKNVLCYLRLILNPADDPSLRRIYSWPARGIGRTTFEKLSDLAFKTKRPLTETLGQALNKDNDPESASDLNLTLKAAQSCQRLVQELSHFRAELQKITSATAPEVKATQIGEWCRQVFSHFKIKEAIQDEEKDNPLQAHKRYENVEELIHSFTQMARGDHSLKALDAMDLLGEFLNRMSLQAQEDELDKEEDQKSDQNNQVTLLTLHGAKGLEFSVVFLVGFEEGNIPHQRVINGLEDISEERRLAYVGITRAKESLLITRVKNRIRYGKPVPRFPSRFLTEIPKELISTQDRSLPDANSSKDHQIQHEERVMSFLSTIKAKLQK